MNRLQSYRTGRNPDFIYYGRNSLSEQQCTFFWTGSGVEFNMQGSELWLETEVPEEVLPPWIMVQLNGTLLAKFQLPKGRSKTCIFSGTDSMERKNIRIRKDSAARFEEQDSFFTLCNIFINGVVKPISKPVRKLEFIGDSITAGEGLGGGQRDQYHEPWLSSSIPDYHYAERTAAFFQADIRVIAHGGWGVYSSWDNQLDHNMPAIYSRICGVAASESAKRLGAQDRYYDAEWKPDAVIINLGTNDAAAFKHSKQPDEQKLSQAVLRFLQDVRSCNPEALIVWMYGMLKNQVEKPIVAGIEHYRQNSSDHRVVYLILPDTKEEEFGSLKHPGPASHIRAADRLSRILETWNVFEK